MGLKDCESGTIIADKKVDRDSGDNVEADANTYAYELLLGKSDIRASAPRNCNAIALASLAIASGKRDGVDPGFIALNYSWTALKLIEPQPNAPEKINSYLLKYLDFDRISSDRQEYLALVTIV